MDNLDEILAIATWGMSEQTAKDKKAHAKALIEKLYIKRSEVEKLIKQTHPIILTTEMIAEGDLADDVVRHWDLLRKLQLQALIKEDR